MLRGDDIEQSLKNEFKEVKRKAADVIDDQATKLINSKRKKRRKQPKAKRKNIIKQKGDLFG